MLPREKCRQHWALGVFDSVPRFHFVIAIVCGSVHRVSNVCANSAGNRALVLLEAQLDFRTVLLVFSLIDTKAILPKKTRSRYLGADGDEYRCHWPTRVDERSMWALLNILNHIVHQPSSIVRQSKP